ncbi:hypothetical protein PPL_05194 [Heterostelium album PN500]|uniref:Uncharacterized protein n=1 Tax=Heterostelium pallidum (strain ATCC 26659 / Pp 5 / PN500) TaxID=670386 RepID=D3B9P8_HETP5|nr:hypothetical protein PPL_05194 [Heterostelium album PN500]EFA81960.1 hypothetical protein PPL_05194 [Heterostelium album PN500]|eukprot:XP_020434077.1 hypothetical protein PPL_05194 [Heterostelium album PN500]
MFVASWYRFYDDLSDNVDVSISGTHIKQVFTTSIAFAAISWIFTTITIIINIVDRIKSGLSKLKFGRFLPIVAFLFALFSVLVMQATPKALSSDCSDSSIKGFVWIGSCEGYGCFKNLNESGQCGASTGWVMMIIATITSFFASLFSSIFIRYGVALAK